MLGGVYVLVEFGVICKFVEACSTRERAQM